MEVRDSYKEFLEDFCIDKEELFQWGIEHTIFPDQSKAKEEWENLKRRIHSDEVVYIRRYGRGPKGTQLYQDAYRELLGNNHIKEDPTNNAIPRRLIQRLTGLKRNASIYNYQVSHIWGHTKNIFLFEAPWNLCYVPKIMDPFTGHETKGVWPNEYQRLFRARAYEQYKPFILEYNQILEELSLSKRIQEYVVSLQGVISEKEQAQFKKDILAEFTPIEMNNR